MTIDFAKVFGDDLSLCPNWKAIGAWIKRNVDASNRRQAWRDAATFWLDRLNQAFGGAYEVRQRDQLLFWCPRGHANGDFLLDYTEWAKDRAVELFGDVVVAPEPKTLVVLLFATLEAYYEYIAQFYDDGHWGGSGGMCITSCGLTHIVLRPYQIDSLKDVIAHELTHVLLEALPLPRWFEEGIARSIEESNRIRSDWFREQMRQARQCWRSNGLDEFWWGAGFHRHDEFQEASYCLAEVLVRQLLIDHPAQFHGFVRSANQSDAGESAAIRYFGKDLSSVAAGFLGPGDWSPQPKTARAYVRRGDLRRADGQFDQAAADYQAALLIKPNHVIANINLAWIMATCDDDRLRNGEQAEQHAKRACESTTVTSWYLVDTLAAACAEAGHFDEACQWATRSLQLAPESERSGCVERLALYESGMPYRAPKHLDSADADHS